MADTGPSDIRPEHDIYTVLVIIGTVFLVIGTVVIGVRSQSLFGTWLPF